MTTKESGSPPVVLSLLCVTKVHLELRCCNVACFGDFELPICGEGRAPPSESRATQDLRGYERTGLATRFTLLTVTLLSRSLNSPLAQCARGHKIGPVRVVMSSNQRNVRPPFRKILFFNSRCTHFPAVRSHVA